MNSLHWVHYLLLSNPDNEDAVSLNKNFRSLAVKTTKALEESGAKIFAIDYNKSNGLWDISRLSNHYDSSIHRAKKIYKKARLLYEKNDFLEAYNELKVAYKVDPESVDINLLLLRIISKHSQVLSKPKRETDYIQRNTKTFLVGTKKEHENFVKYLNNFIKEIFLKESSSKKLGKSWNLYEIITNSKKITKNINKLINEITAKTSQDDPSLRGVQKIIDKLAKQKKLNPDLISAFTYHERVEKVLEEKYVKQESYFFKKAKKEYGFSGAIQYCQLIIRLELTDNPDINWALLRDMDESAKNYLVKIIEKNKDLQFCKNSHKEVPDEVHTGEDNDEKVLRSDNLLFKQWQQEQDTLGEYDEEEID